MKNLKTTILASGILAIVPSLQAQTTLMSQNFDTSPVNYTNSPFVNGTGATNPYWNLSNNVTGVTLNGNLSGNATNYLTGQDMDAIGFAAATPARMDFSIPATGFSNLTLSLDLAGSPSAESINFVRALTDDNGDGTYETTVFNFQGSDAPSNSPYINTLNTTQQLSVAFQNFSGYTLPTPTGSNLLLRFEVFNDTGSQNENVGIDNIVVSGVPEPTTGLLVLTGLLGLARRRRS